MNLRRTISRRLRPDRRPFILAYHRVKDLDIDPWGLAVSPATFEQHVRTLARHTGGEIDRSIFQGNSARAFITFDDGYGDNLEYALPILKKYGASATVFLATGYIGCGREFWWDRLERIFLLPGRLPDILRLHVLGDDFVFPLKRDAHYPTEAFSRYRLWKPWQEPPTTRQGLFSFFWSLLHRSNRGYQDAMVAALEEWSGLGSAPRPHFAPIRAQQAREMQNEGIQFGAHTVDHIAINHSDPATILHQTEDSIRAVTAITDRPTTVFSYPYGQTHQAAQETLARLGITVACTSRKDRINPDTPPLAVPRLCVGNSSLPLIQSLVR
jgi:peptidoglycan/xylan/chitin deacetylase (PgdA/CDA1 family)